MNDLLFDIPVYLRSNERFEDDRQSFEDKMKQDWGGDYALGKKISIRWPPWEYNDIIGYYKIIIHCSADPGSSINGVRVEKYFYTNKRIGKNPISRNVKIWLKDPWFHKRLSAYYDDEHDLRNILRKVLDDLYDKTKEESKRKRYYIDIAYYKNLIECMDFEKYRQLVEKNN